MMSNDSNAFSMQSLPGKKQHVIEMEGIYGSVTWRVSSNIYDIMQRDTRDELLDLVAFEKIHPRFEQLVSQILQQSGRSDITPRLYWCDEISTENVEIHCLNLGLFIWQLSQPLWDSIPEDQRANLLSFACAIVHTDFLDGYIAPRLLLLARQNM